MLNNEQDKRRRFFINLSKYNVNLQHLFGVWFNCKTKWNQPNIGTGTGTGMK